MNRQIRLTCSRIIRVRFPEGGRVAWVKAHSGDEVRKGQPLAALDKKLKQLDLDKELAEYEQVRLEFDKLANQIQNVDNDDEKFRKQMAQARLNLAVKAVEKSKYLLDNLTLISPVNGWIIDDSSLVDGIWITPSGYEYQIADKDSLVFEMVTEKKDSPLLVGQKGSFKLETGEEGETSVLRIVLSDKPLIHLSAPNDITTPLGTFGTFTW